MKDEFKINPIRITLILFILATTVYPGIMRAALQLELGLPQGEFKENVNKPGFGAGFTLTANLHKNLAIGLGASVLYYGSETREEHFPAPVTDIGVEVKRTNNLASACLLAQPFFKVSRFKPYLEGRFGFNYFVWTKADIKNLSDDEKVGSTNFDDIALSYGCGGGVMINFYEKHVEATPERKAFTWGMSADIKMLYLYGGKAGFIKEGSFSQDGDGDITYDISKSKTDMLNIFTGIVFEF